MAKWATTITATAKDGIGVSATCNVSVYSYDAPDAIDLGQSVKWANFNVGASSPEEAGVYFSWGENSPKEDYSWPKYKWCYGTDNTISKYNTREVSGIVDGMTTLETDDDVAREKLGGFFRIPTPEEIKELFEKCSWTWTSLNGVNDYKVTSTIEGYTDKWIFLPAAGYFSGKELKRKGSIGYYWSSSINPDSPRYAYHLEFSSGNYDNYNGERCEGMPIRAVVE
jgi:uncharacterized protein (TIGR02145 family)